MLKIAIIDDNEEIVQLVQKQVEECIEETVIVEPYTQADLLFFDVREGKEYDIYFMDIEMPGINGLDLAKKIREVQSEARIIFLTSHAEFALASYDLKIQAYQYILKRKMHELLPAVIKAVVSEIRKEHSYTIQYQMNFSRVRCDEVLYIYKNGKHVIITTSDREYKERKTLEQVVKGMNSPELIYIDRGCVVNILHICHIRNDEIEMDNGKKLLISRNKISKVKNAVHEYWSVEE